MVFGRRNKYGAKATIVDGIRFASQLEATRYGQLRTLQHAKLISRLERQVEYRFVVNEVLIAKYRADFRYRSLTGQLVVEDVKGFRTRMYTLKRKLMLALYHITITEWPHRTESRQKS